MKTPEPSVFSWVKGFWERQHRKLLLGLGVATLVMVVGVVGGGWYYAERLRSGALEAHRSSSEPDLEVVALGEGQITLRRTEKASPTGDWRKDGVFGLEWEGGYGQVGGILVLSEQQVVREFTPVRGVPRVGEPVRIDGFAFPGDPEEAFDIPFRNVTFVSEVGEFPAWFIEGSRDTWVVFVHGRGASRREGLRILPTVRELGLPLLMITYRNDEGAPASPDGFYRFGQTEWEDLEAAVQYAITQGAENLVLVGYSMGGGIVVNFLYESPLAERVAGVILDAPMLDFEATIDFNVEEGGTPEFLIAAGKAVAGFRFDIAWDDLNYLKRADELDVPILLIHGDEDQTVPIGTSDALAEARADIVTYVQVAGAGHVRAWNADPSRYEAEVREFLARVAR